MTKLYSLESMFILFCSHMGMYNLLVTRMVIIHIKEQIVILCTSIVMWRAYDALCSIKKLILDISKHSKLYSKNVHAIATSLFSEHFATQYSLKNYSFVLRRDKYAFNCYSYIGRKFIFTNIIVLQYSVLDYSEHRVTFKGIW
jgi:hypothetical protein